LLESFLVLDTGLIKFKSRERKRVRNGSYEGRRGEEREAIGFGK